MEKKKLLERTKVLLAVILALVVVFCYFLMGRTSAVKGLNTGTDELKKSTLKNMYRQETIEGAIWDSSKTILSQGTEPGKSGTLFYPESYSWLLGYNDPVYGKYGLRGRYESYLYMQGENKKGADITLTLNHQIQEKAYSLIEGMEGSMIVLDIRTGRILALASSKTVEFNANQIADHMEEWNQTEGFFLPNGFKDAAEPGSTFKMVTAAALLEQGLEKDIIEDKGNTVLGGHVVKNSGNAAFGTIALQEALGNSSNVYFGTMALRIGGSTLERKASQYLIGQDIELDFITLESHLDMGDYSEALIADTGYGQGKTLVTPLHLAMIAQSIGNGGVMLRPYLVDEITLDGKTLYKGKEEELAIPLRKENAETLKNLMQVTAGQYYGMTEYGICAKSGTAEVAGDKNKCYLVTFNEDYVVAACKLEESGYGIQLKGAVMNMYDKLYSR